MYESPCTASGSLRPDVGTQSLAVSIDGLSDSRPTIRAYREAYATLKDLPGRAREGQFGAVNRLVGAWDVYRRYPFTICGGVLLAAAPFLSKGN